MKTVLFVSILILILAVSFSAFSMSCGAGGGNGGDGTETFSVGGVVTGLNGTLVLQNNGGDDLTITEDGAFTFETELEDGDSYSVTVLTQPVSQSCTLSGESGTIDGADVADVLVTLTDKSWSHPSGLSDNFSPDGQDARYPQVAMDSGGNAIITWWQSDGSNTQIFKSEYENGAWAHPTDLNDNISPDGEDADETQVAMDDSGNVVIVWKQSDGFTTQIFKSENRNGNWSHPASLFDNISPGGKDAAVPQAAMDFNGNAVVVWRQYYLTITNILKSEYRNGSWMHPSGLSDYISHGGYNADNPHVAMDSSGNAIIVWEQSDSNNSQIYKSEYRNGAWTHPTGLSDNISPDGQDAHGPKVAMDNSGNAVITWRQYDNDGNTQIYTSEYRNGAWSHPSGISDHISPTGQIAAYPEVAMDSVGNVIIVWEQLDESLTMQIFMSEYRNGTWTHPASLSDSISPDGQRAYFPQVVLDNNGTAVITWEQFDDSGNMQIFMSDYKNGSWSHPATPSDNISPDGQHAWYPEVAMDSNGNIVIVWEQYNEGGSNIQIFKSEFR